MCKTSKMKIKKLCLENLKIFNPCYRLNNLILRNHLSQNWPINAMQSPGKILVDFFRHRNWKANIKLHGNAQYPE